MRSEINRAVELLRSNNDDHLNEAVRLLQNTVYSFSMKVCGHPEDAEDTAQDVLMTSLKHLHKIGDERAMSVWLYTAAKNRCIRTRRKGAFGPSRILALDELMPDDSELQRLLQDPRPTPELQLSSLEQLERLHDTILALPPQYRLVLVLHDVEVLGTEQVAQILQIKPATVRIRLHRARLALRRLLAQSSHPGKLQNGSKPRRSTHCRAIFAKLSDYIDSRIGTAEHDELEQHLEVCAPCIAFLRDLRQVIQRCHSFQAQCPPDVQKRLRALFERQRKSAASVAAKKLAYQV